MAMTSIGRWLMPHNARRPPRLPGATLARPVVSSFQIPHATADCQASAAVASTVASQRGIRNEWAITAVATKVAPTIAP